MANTKRTVEIDVKVTGVDQVTKLTNLADKFDNIAKSVSKLSETLGGFKTSIEGIKIPADFTKAIDGLKDLSKIGKLPDVDNVAKGFQKLGKIDNIPNLSGFVSELKKFKEIKVPNINQVATGIKKLSESSANVGESAAKLNKLYYSLNNFSNVKLPNFDKFIAGFEKLKALDVGGIATKLKDMNTAISNLDKAGHLNSFSNFAKNLNQVSTALTKASEGLAKAKKAVKETGEGFAAAGAKVKTFGDRLRNYVQYRVIADTIMSMRDAFYNGIQAITEYDQALKDLEAITGATGLEVEQMGEKIKEVASSTKFSASEVAAGMRTIGQAGFTAAESIGTMQSVSDLATGTLSDMSTSVDLVTTAMRVYSIDASESSRVSDVFANAVNRSKLTIDKLRTAMNYVGPIAKNAGVTFEEMSASMMTLANSGIQASKIGTGLRRVFAELLDPSAKLEQAARRAGIALQDLDPRTATLSDVFKNLGVVVNDAEIAFDLFGKRGASAVLALTNNQSQFDTLLDSVGRSGTAAAMAATQIEGLAVSFKNLKDKLGLLAISIGELGITDVLRVLIDVAKRVVDVITALVDTAFAKFIGKSAILVASVYAITKAFRALLALNIGANIGIMVGKMIALSAATVTAEGAAAGLLLAFNPLIALFAAAAAGLVYLFATMDRAKEASEDAAKLADDYANLGKSFQDYLVNTANMAEGSTELKDENLKLRTSLLDTASGMSDVSDEAAAAAAQIHPLTGKILDGGEALKKYNIELGNLTLKSLVDSAEAASENIDKQSGGISRFINRWQDAFSQVGTLGAGLGNSILAGFEGEFSQIPDIVKKTFQETSQYGDAVKESMDFSKEIDKGNVSFRQLSDYVNSLNFSNLTQQQSELAEAYKLLNERSDAVLKNLLETGQVDLNDTIENITTFAEKSGLAGLELDAVITKIKALQGSEGDYSNILEKWAIDAENLNTSVSAFIPEFQALGGEISAAQAQQIANSDTIKKNLSDEYALAKEKLAAEIQGGADKEKAYREFYAEEKRLLAESQKVIADAANNTAAQTIIALMKAKDELIRSQNEINVKYKDNIQLLVKYLTEAETKYETSKAKILGNIVNPQELLAESKANAKAVKETYSSMYKDLELEVINRTKTEKDAAAIRRKLEVQEAKEITAIWDEANQAIIEQNDPESPSSRSIANSRRDAAIAQGKVEIDVAKEAAREQLEAKKDLYERQAEVRETNFAAEIAALDEQEQKGVLTHQEAEVAKMNATINRYAEEYRIAKEYHESIDQGQNPDEYQRSLNEMLDMEEAYYEAKGDYVAKYNKQVDKLNDKLEDKLVDRLNAEKKNAKKLEDIQEDLADDLADIEEDHIDDILDMKHDYAKDVEDIEYDLAKKIQDIKKDLAEKLKDIDEDIVDNKKKLKADLLGIEKDSDDIEKDIRQRGMSERQKDADNEKSIYRELGEIKEGISKAEKEGNSDSLQHYQDRLKGLQKESGELKNKGEALAALHAVEDEMVRARKAENRVEQIKLENDQLKEQKKAQEEIKEAQAEAAYEKQQLTEKFDYEVSLIEKKRDKKIAAEEEAAQKAIDAENYRHQNAMDNLDREIAKIQEKLGNAQQSASSAASAEITRPTSSEKDIAENPIAKQAQQAKVAIQEMDSQMTQTASNMIQKSKEVANTGFRAIEENGKTVYTNLSDAQRESFKIMGEAMLSDSQGTMDAVSESTAKGAAQIEEAVNAMKAKAEEEIPINVEQEPEVPDVQAQLPELVEVPLSLTVDTVNNEIDDVKANLNTIAETEVKADVQLVSGEGTVSDAVTTVGDNIKTLSETEVPVEVTFNTEVVDEIAAQLTALSDVGIEVQVTVTGTDLVTTLHELLSEMIALSPVTVPVTTSVDGKEEVMALKLLMEEILDLAKKAVKIVAEVTGIEKVYELRDAISSLKDKTVTVTTRHVEERSGGGEIGKYANGGTVFSRLANRYISSGSGHKDDVPALLMKGEFVHKTSAVRKYGQRFMQMVNSGLYPVELAKQAIQKYADGGSVGVNIAPNIDTSGFVQQFATGGMVLSGMLGSLKKRLFDMLGKTIDSDVNLNIDNINLKSDVQQRADGITSGIGQEAIESMAGTFNDAVAQFADGGGITNTTLMFDRERQKIENQYDKQISAAKKTGNDEIANLLAQEREDLKIIADTLQSELTASKEAYDEAVSSRKLENNEDVAQINTDYDRDVSDENESYRRDVEDDTLDYQREEDDYLLESSRAKEELALELEEIQANITDNEKKILDALISSKADVADKIKELDDFGRYLTEISNINGGRVYTGENTFHYKEDYRNKTWDGISNDPSLAMFESMINQAFRHGTGQLGTAGKEDALTKLDTLWNEFASSNLSLREEYGLPEVNVLLDDSAGKIRQVLSGIGVSLGGDPNEHSLLERLAISLNKNPTQDDIDKANSDYQESKYDRDLDWSRYKEDYAIETSRRDVDHSTKLTDLKTAYETAIDEQATSLAEDLTEYKSTYEEEIASLEEKAATDVETRKEQTSGDVLKVKESLQETLAGLDSSLKEELMAKSTAEKLATPAEDIPTPEADERIKSHAVTSIEELLRRLKFPKFNVGGFVQHTVDSIPGKDSIMAALTPGEYVIKEPAVKMFGQGFFDSLNNFQIPKFNLGGVVGPIQKNITETLQQTSEKYALDLTINGNSHESLYGSKQGIDGILNDLNLAKLRS